jgi:hypothetical protein
MGYFKGWVSEIEIGIGTPHFQDCPLLPGTSEDLMCQPKKVSFFKSLAG